MSIYTTPLQFGYFLALSMAIMFWIRGNREERHSDVLLGWVMFFLAMEVQDYTFGFAGIDILWDELNGFPRGTALLFGPSVYFYLRAQVNRDFRITKHHLWHLLPWFITFVIDLIIFLNGADAVQRWQSSSWHHYMSYPRQIVLWTSYTYYFWQSLSLYQSYRHWAQNQYSDQDIISFNWFRNLIYFMISGILFKEGLGIIDNVFELDFYQDWWWNLAMVAIIFYVGIWGYAQAQPAEIRYKSDDYEQKERLLKEDLSHWKHQIEQFMKEHKPHLEPSLTLKSLALKLKTNPSVLSAAINQNFNKNFNDFINEYRINAFLELIKNKETQHYTLLALAMECGFNSKSTFNRAFKKITGETPTSVAKTNS